MVRRSLIAQLVITLCCLGYLGVLVQSASCASAPPSLSPTGALAFNMTRVVQALDMVRDAAIAANAQTPPRLSTASTRRVVLWHQATVTILAQLPSGWKATVLAGLTQLSADVPAADAAQLAPYLALVKALVDTL